LHELHELQLEPDFTTVSFTTTGFGLLQPHLVSQSTAFVVQPHGLLHDVQVLQLLQGLQSLQPQPFDTSIILLHVLQPVLHDPHGLAHGLHGLHELQSFGLQLLHELQLEQPERSGFTSES
jgi:hypothetical protein